MRIYLETVSMHMYLYSLIYLHMQNRKFHMQSIFKYLSTTTIPNYINYRKREKIFISSSSIFRQMLMLFAPKNTCRKKIKNHKKKLSLQSHFRQELRSLQFFRFFSSNKGLIGILSVFPISCRICFFGVPGTRN